MNSPGHDLAGEIAARYRRRDAAADAQRYSLFDAAAMQAHQELQRGMVELWRRHGWRSLDGRHILEVGCGTGGNLLDLLRLGAAGSCLAGIDILPERAMVARSCLPASVAVVAGDAVAAAVDPASQDLVLAFTVFSSLLDDGSQSTLAAAMWRWVKPGGGVLVYDFAVDNPRNPDVRGVPVARLRQLFPGGPLSVRRVTLAPPLARLLARVHPALVGVLAPVLQLLRTHRLVWIPKP
jgi:SAM-dependent methyltransferase